MKHLKLIFFLVALLNTIWLNGQTVNIEGVVLNTDDEKGIPNITVFTHKQQTGTATNSTGHFSLSVPHHLIGSYLYFSGIGFKTDSVLITNQTDKQIIKLSPETYVLQEVLIMPDSTLLTLLRNAFNSIDRNYPAQPSAYSGFYRESIQDDIGDQIDFTESILHIYKDSYARPTGLPGQIEIIKSRKRNFQNRNKRYIGGPFLTIEMDEVLKRKRPINPRYFKDYDYQFNGIVTKDGLSFYSISWKKKDSDKDINQSTFLIEKESLAYAEFVDNNVEGSAQLSLKDIYIDKRIIYEKVGQLWYLKYVTYKNRHTDKINNKPRIGVIEYTTLSIQLDGVVPIPHEKRLSYFDAIAHTADDYTKSDWVDYARIENDNKLNTIFTFSPQESMHIFQTPVSAKKQLSDILIKVLTNLNIEYGISYRKIETPSNSVALSFAPLQNMAPFELVKTDNFVNDNIFLEALVGYRINKNVNVFYSGISDIGNKQMQSSLQSVGVEYRKNIKQQGYPFFLQGSLALGKTGYHMNMGVMENTNAFIYQGKNFNADQLKFAYGIESVTVTPEIAVKSKISRLFGIKLFAQYHLPFSTKEMLSMKEANGSLLTRKSIKINKEDDSVKNNNAADPWESLTINNWSVGVSLTFN